MTLTVCKIVTFADKATDVHAAVGGPGLVAVVNPPFLIQARTADNSLVTNVVEEAV